MGNRKPWEGTRIVKEESRLGDLELKMLANLIGKDVLQKVSDFSLGSSSPGAGELWQPIYGLGPQG